MRRKQLGMSPAKIAIAVAVTIEAIAGTGGMKNVTGTSRAVAMVAVSPGTAPTNSPNIAEPRITHSTYGSSTSLNASKSIALEDSPRQGNAQQLVERQVDHDGGDGRRRQREAPRSTEHAYPHDGDQQRGEVEAQPVCGQHVEEEPAEHRGHRKARPRAAQPARKRDPRTALAQAGGDQPDPAQAQSGGHQPREPRRAELLARHRRESLDVPEDRRGERDQRRAGERIMELYLASPTAFSAPPRLASEAAMNFAVSCGSAQITPKPRLAMKSL